MNDLGLAMAWCAVQVSVVLIPAAALHAWASRRGPAAGAWVASLSLGLVFAFSLLSLAPRGGVSLPTTAGAAGSQASAPSGRGADLPRGLRSDEGESEGVGTGWSIAALRGAWERLETTAAAPAARCRRWGSVLATVALAGAGGGLLHLIAGLGGVHLCLRRSRPVDDPGLDDLVRELRGALGCRRRVEVRETSELTTPATAGWRRPVLLLPDDWRSWDECERRAVVAHELAHVCRDDYATGVMARLALVIHFYHPVVHWLAARLTLEQELAADALGARFAGGRGRYLQSLSRLALRQDGRSPCGPARAFLPAKRNLIRRIAMLRDENLSNNRPWSAPRRAASALLLLAVAGGVLTLRGPARGDDLEKRDDAVKAVHSVSRPDQVQGEPFHLTYLPEDARGFWAARPAATFRRAGMGTYRAMLNLWIARQWSEAANKFGFDPAKPGQGPPRVEMFEEVMGLVSITQRSVDKPRWSLQFGDVISVRTSEPVDWVGLCRNFHLELTEVHEGNRVYYRLKKDPRFGPEDGGLYLPDDRTLVFSSEKRIRQLMQRTAPTSPVFAQGKGWDRCLRGLSVVAFDSRDGLLRKAISDVPDLLDSVSQLKDGGLLTISLDNSDEIAVNGVVTLSDAGAGESTALALPTLLKSLRKELSDSGPEAPKNESPDFEARLLLDLVTNCRVERDGRSVLLHSTGLGTIADYASRMVTEFMKSK